MQTRRRHHQELQHHDHHLCALSAASSEASSFDGGDDHYDDETHRSGNRRRLFYWTFLGKNRNFQLYWWSGLLNHISEWLTYLATISFIQSTTRRISLHPSWAVGCFMVLRLLPAMMLMPLGGVLADGLDRRNVMITLDLASSVVTCIFPVALHLESIHMIMAATLMQACLRGLYEPSRSAMIPLIVGYQPDPLLKATTISTITWSAVAAFGAAVGPFVMTALDFQTCHCFNGLTYLLSALLLSQLKGNLNTAIVKHHFNDKNDRVLSRTSTFYLANMPRMLIDGVKYLYSSFFGGLVLMKASASIVNGGFHVVAIAMAGQGAIEDIFLRLRWLFASAGVGCVVGPILLGVHIDMSIPISLQKGCLYALGFIAMSCILLAYLSSNHQNHHHDPFWMICLLSACRAMGTSSLWVQSTLLLQGLSTPHVLGRVSSLDLVLALSMEILSAFVVLWFHKSTLATVNETSPVLGMVAIVIWIVWLVYHSQERGAAELEEVNTKDRPFLEKCATLHTDEALL